MPVRIQNHQCWRHLNVSTHIRVHSICYAILIFCVINTQQQQQHCSYATRTYFYIAVCCYMCVYVCVLMIGGAVERVHTKCWTPHGATVTAAISNTTVCWTSSNICFVGSKLNILCCKYIYIKYFYVLCVYCRFCSSGRHWWQAFEQQSEQLSPTTTTTHSCVCLASVSSS